MDWEQRLEPFARRLEEMTLEISNMSDRDLEKLEIACGEPTSSNCSWSIYRIAPLIAKQVHGERFFRAQKRARQ